MFFPCVGCKHKQLWITHTHVGFTNTHTHTHYIPQIHVHTIENDDYEFKDNKEDGRKVEEKG